MLRHPSFFAYDGHAVQSVVKVHKGVVADEPIATPKVYIVRCKREEGIAKS